MRQRILPRVLFLCVAVLLLSITWLRPVGAAHARTEKRTSRVDSSVLAAREAVSSGAVTDLYFSQLSKEEKQAYTALTGADLKQGKAYWRPSVSFTLAQETARIPSLVKQEEKIQELFRIGERALYAFRLDYMDRVYWMYDCDVDVNWTVTSLGGGQAQVEIQYVAFTPIAYYGGAISEDGAVQAALQEAVESILAESKNTSRAQTVLAIASYMAAELSYGNTGAKVAHTPSGALLSRYGHTAVCEGYARVFFMICKRLGIPVVYVESKTHAYTCVQLENGAWYGVDVSWADVGTTLDQKWLLFGSSFVTENDVSKAHVAYLSRYGASFSAISLTRESYTWK